MDSASATGDVDSEKFESEIKFRKILTPQQTPSKQLVSTPNQSIQSQPDGIMESADNSQTFNINS